MRGAIGLVRLGAAAGVDPNTNSRSLSPGRVLRRNLPSIESIAAQAFAENIAYREAVAQGRRLSLCTVGDGSGQASCDGRPDAVDGGAAAHRLMKVERQPPGSHGD